MADEPTCNRTGALPIVPAIPWIDLKNIKIRCCESCGRDTARNSAYCYRCIQGGSQLEERKDRPCFNGERIYDSIADKWSAHDKEDEA